MREFDPDNLYEKIDGRAEEPAEMLAKRLQAVIGAK